jgi:metal-responsive CopG/Arc/MetJ family transcriptional regulator
MGRYDEDYKRMIQVQVNIPQDVYKRLEEFKRLAKEDRTSIIRKALRQYLDAKMQETETANV